MEEEDKVKKCDQKRYEKYEVIEGRKEGKKGMLSKEIVKRN